MGKAFWCISIFLQHLLREKYQYSELFWSAVSCIWTVYGEILHISSYSMQMGENADQKNFKYGQRLCNKVCHNYPFWASVPKS